MDRTKDVQPLSKVFFNVDHEADVSPFKALHIRVREKIVADGFEEPLDWGKSGREVPPEEWHERLKSASSDAILLDCRNMYETEVGKFEGAEPLNTTFFRDSWNVLADRLKDVPSDTPVM
eukprot:1392612-Prorocentrum_lima.AAC.1